MERLDDYDNLQLLRRANERLARFFARFAGAPVLGTQEEVEALLQVESAMQSIAALLDGGLQNPRTAEVRDEVAQYRANLVRLRDELAIMQNAATKCRQRLLARNQHLQAAQAWCAASRATT